MTPYYDEDGITIYHADCVDVLPAVNPAAVDLVLTDPPYGIGLDTANQSRGRTVERANHDRIHSQPRRSLDHPKVHGDDRPFDPTHLVAFGRCVLWGAHNYADSLPRSSSWIVWDRQSGDSDTADAELAWTNLGGTVRTFRHTWNGVCRDSEIGFHVHPTQKPVSLMKWILDRWTDPGDLILDPYMGSGPVAQACHEMGRRYIGVEIVEDYCKVAVQRLAQGVLAL